ncbi:uroporphyrinogen decarboxylase [bacterium]|nr:uroporphyrinogen decarboxylase [bacterium]MCI0604437.1 uroporphyrinogen decarboxylase [bacterium]
MSNDLQQSRFLKACRKESVDCTPVWLMRQAGRYMQEYRELRQKYSLLTLCKTPELAAEITLQPIRRYPLDAAIIFADILLPLEPLGLHLEFAKGEGPVINNPVSNPTDVASLETFDVNENLGFVLQAIRLAVHELKGIPLIGFAGAPFTVASYAIEGGYSRHFLKTKQFMYRQPEAWHELMEKISSVTAEYLRRQIEAGASAVQMFDSWVGVLGPEDYCKYVLPYSKIVLSNLAAPAIHFSTGTAAYLDLICEAGGEIISVDWRVDLRQAWNRIGDHAIQGNLDPAHLLMNTKELRQEVRKVLSAAGGQNGHIFNLGHGVFPDTPDENVAALVEEVHKWKP